MACYKVFQISQLKCAHICNYFKWNNFGGITFWPFATDEATSGEYFDKSDGI